MKSRLIQWCMLILFAMQAQAQNSYIVPKKGDKIIVRDDAIEILVVDDRISYKIPGKTWEKYITFKDLDSAVVGEHVFKSFKINGKGSPQGYFVLAYYGGNKLLGKAITYSGNHSSTTRVYYKVLDKNNMLLGQAELWPTASDKKNEECEALVRQYFGTCKNISPYLSDLWLLATEAIFHTCK